MPRPARRPAIIQLVNDMHPQDAVGQQALWIDALLRARGAVTQIHAWRARGPLPAHVRRRGRLFLPPPPLPRADLLILHHSIGTHLADGFLHPADPAPRRAIIYHNITPPQMLAAMPALAAHAHWGLRQLPAITAASDLVIACSQFNLRDVLPLRPRRAEVLHLAPPPQRLQWLEHVARQRQLCPRPPDPARPRLLALGRVVPSKNLQLAIQAAAALPAIIPQCRPTLVLAGPQPDPAHVQQLRQIAQNSGLPPEAVRFTGPLGDPEIADEMLRADILLQPSLHEGFGMPPVEAMHARLPVIAANSGALPEILGPQATLLPPDHPALWAQTIAQTLQTPQDPLIEAMAQRAKERFHPKTQEERAANLLLGLCG